MKTLLNHLAGLVTLFVYWALGEFLTHTLPFSIPGALVGMMLLLFTLILLKRVPVFLDAVSQPLLKHMALFFIPAIMGVWLHRDLLTDFAFSFFGVVVLSTMALMVIVGRIAQSRLTKRSDS